MSHKARTSSDWRSVAVGWGSAQVGSLTRRTLTGSKTRGVSDRATYSQNALLRQALVFRPASPLPRRCIVACSWLPGKSRRQRPIAGGPSGGLAK